MRQSTIMRSLTGAIAAAVLAGWAGLAASVPTSLTDLPQVTAEAPLRVPMTRSCTETVLTHLFANSYYSPGYGAHKASACAGPWSFVSLGIDVSVSGVQFDRMFDIYIGQVPLLSSSTSEPASEIPNAVTHWHVDADVSRFAGLLASDQPITAILNNVNDDTYTGQYQVTLTLTYYATSSDAPAIVPPDYVGALFEGGDSKNPSGPGNLGTSGYPQLDKKTLSWSHDLTLPSNLLTLVADVYAQGHGACEEFWWSEPGQCGTGTPLRQVVLSIDGAIAGFAPVYPVLFTGGGGPGSWNPIPSPRAWHVDPYRFDLTPFVGLLVDGKPHRFTITVPDAAFSDAGDYWVVGGTLLGGVDPLLTQTSGSLTSAPVAAAATISSSTDPVAGAVTQFTGSRTGSWTGTVTGSAGRIDSSVSSTFDISSLSSTLVNSTWHWTSVSKRALPGATATTSTVERTYGLHSAGIGGGQFGDSTSITVEGAKPFTRSTDLQLATAGALYANVTQVEHYQGSDSTGYCYGRVVNAAAGYVLADTLDPTCGDAGTGFGSGPVSSFGSGSDQGFGGTPAFGTPPAPTPTPTPTPTPEPTPTPSPAPAPSPSPSPSPSPTPTPAPSSGTTDNGSGPLPADAATSAASTTLPAPRFGGGALSPALIAALLLALSLRGRRSGLLRYSEGRRWGRSRPG
jgi:Peptide N-acetyl-beta-D-glucosaminyl asparaginase amidase A